jgi:hypothetical protein
MKITEIFESTTSGSIAPVESAMNGGKAQKREAVNVQGLKPVNKVRTAKKKGPFANSIIESKIKEAQIEENDLILIPGQGHKIKPGFHAHDPDKAEHEGETLKNSLHTIARAAMKLDKHLSTRDNFPEWVSEKIGAVKGMMTSVMQYLISKQEMHQDGDIDEMGTGGVVAGGGVGEGKKVDRMEKHIEKSERKAGYSKEEAEKIAWATLNKRGYLNNKNKKKKAK